MSAATTHDTLTATNGGTTNRATLVTVLLTGALREAKPGMVSDVTETRALDEVINEALAVIDKGLGDLLHRELVSTNEVADLLLDVRTLLANPTTGREASDDGVVVAS